VVVEGYFTPAGRDDRRRPSVLEVLGSRDTAASGTAAGREIYIDHHALDDGDVDDPAAIARQAELSSRVGNLGNPSEKT
jgi:hypothetical protein